MQETLFAILTDEQSRSNDSIETNLNQQLESGAPWFSKALTKPFDTIQTDER